jgi:CMP-N-acetylneuraminic acid synthetase
MDRMVSSRRIAIIPARGGSKRIPRKNIVPIAGRPMLAWTIEAALQSGQFDRIVVSTEDEEIATIARGCGAEAPFLRERFFDDHTPISEVTIDALKMIERNEGEVYDTVVQLMANCPLRRARDIVHALQAFDEKARTFQLSCVRFGWLNPWWALTLDRDGSGAPIHPSGFASRSQDLPTLFCPTGAIWIARVPALIAAGTFYGPHHHFEPLPWRTGVDIDDMEDLQLATALLSMEEQPS